MSLRIIQTLWTAPALHSRDYSHHKRGMAMGWRSSFYNAAAWTLSCLLWRQWYGQVHLYTDAPGYHFLVNTLQLPYTTANVILDELHYPPELWIMGKIHVYGLQEAPFLHTDGDTFPFRPLRGDFLASPLLAQHQERVTYYSELYQRLASRLTYEPASFTGIRNRLHEGPAYNNGLIGGSDTAFFKTYSREVKAFIENNISRLELAEYGPFNVLCEQVLYYAMAEQAGTPPACLLTDGELPPPGALWQLRQKIATDGYLHPISSYKRHPLICDYISYKLRSLYPHAYYRLRYLAAEGLLTT